MILKDDKKLKEAKLTFSGSSIRYTTAGKRHLGASIGSTDFRREYATEKINQWCDEVKKLAEIAITEPQAAFAAYTHGEMHKFNYFLRTIPGMEQYLDPLDSIIDNQFLPALLGMTITESDRQLFKLPVKDGGLGIPVLVEKADIDFQSSKIITAPLVAVIVAQDYKIPSKDTMTQIRNERVRQLNDVQKQQRDLVDSRLDKKSKRAMEQNREKGASSWLTFA